jgi:DMSO/TMAO reductase YedYZ molybdopterin-dependent catalytic subunit
MEMPTSQRVLFRVRDLFPLGKGRGLPPGQHAISSYPRYGTHFAGSDPVVPEHPVVEVTGDTDVPFGLDAAALEELPRTELVADFHCVAGWTATGLRWEGVRVRDVYALNDPTADFTHLRAVGRDGFRSVLLLEDALADDVLIADRLDGMPLPVEHGGPFRLVSPGQYGYKSVKHLCRLEFHDSEPSDAHRDLPLRLALRSVAPHPRARVAHEERHASLPSWALRRLYIWGVHPVAYVLGYLGALRTSRHETP